MWTQKQQIESPYSFNQMKKDISLEVQISTIRVFEVVKEKKFLMKLDGKLGLLEQ